MVWRGCGDAGGHWVNELGGGGRGDMGRRTKRNILTVCIEKLLRIGLVVLWWCG